VIKGVAGREKGLYSGTFDGENLAVFDVVLAWVRVAFINPICEGCVVFNEVRHTTCVIAMPVRE